MSDQYPPTGGGPPPSQWPPPGGQGAPGQGGSGQWSGQQQGGPYGPPQGGAYPNYYPQMQADAPGATTALILGILGLVVCGILAPFAWYYGNRALEEIELSGRTLGGHGNAKAGQILGIIGTIILGLVVLYVVFILVLAVGVSSSGT